MSQNSTPWNSATRISFRDSHTAVRKNTGMKYHRACTQGRQYIFGILQFISDLAEKAEEMTGDNNHNVQEIISIPARVIVPITWWVYMVRCADNSLYTGIATDTGRRVVEHNGNDQLAAKYTRGRRPVVLVYRERCASRTEAARREYEIKRLKRCDKLSLIEGQPQ